MIEMMRYLTDEVGIDGMMIAPGYQYSQIDPALTMTRDEHEEKFRAIRAATREHGYRWIATRRSTRTSSRASASSPCAPWGSITRNPYGWKGPCYLLTDGIFPTYEALLEGMEWEDVRPRQRPALRALRASTAASSRRRRTRPSRSAQGDRAEPRMDADGLTLACATSCRGARGAARRGADARSAWPARTASGREPRLVRARRARSATLRGRRRARRDRASSTSRRDALGGPGRSASRGARAGTVLGGDVLVDRRPSGAACASASGADAVDMESGAARPHRPAEGRACDLSDTPTRPLGELVGAASTFAATNVRRASRSRSRRAALDPACRARREPRRCARRPGRGGAPASQNGAGRVLLAAPRSFCAGVDRAIEIVERLLEQHGAAGLRPPPDRPQRARRAPPRGARRRLRRGRGRDPGGRDLRALGARRRAVGEGELRAARPARRRRDLPARQEGARRGAALRRQRPSRRARRPREPRRGDRDARRAAGFDDRDRVAGAGAQRSRRTASRSP